jgi:hypothetical protein
MKAIKNGGHLIFAAQDSHFSMGVKKPGNAAADMIRQLKNLDTLNGSPAWGSFGGSALLNALGGETGHVDSAAQIRHGSKVYLHLARLGPKIRGGGKVPLVAASPPGAGPGTTSQRLRYGRRGASTVVPAYLLRECSRRAVILRRT